MSDTQFNFTDEPENTPPKSETPYSDMGWEDYIKTTLKNTPSSYWGALTALPKALYNYDETAKALYGIGSGVISKLSDVPLVATYDQEGNETRVVPSLREIVGSPRTSVEKQEVEAPLNQFTTALVEPLQSKEAALRTFAEDPIGVASTLSIPFTGGSTAAVKGAALLGSTSKAAKALNAAGKAAKVAGAVMDPTAGVVEGAKVAGGLGRKAIQGGQSFLTGAPYSTFQKAFDVGVLNGPKGAELRKDFISYLKGEGSASEFAQSVNNAFDQLKEAESQKWMAEKGSALGLNTKQVDYDPILNKFDELRKYYGDRTPTGEYAHPDANSALDEVQSAVLSYATSDILENKTIVGLDKLKQRLWEISQKYGDGEGGKAVTGIWKSVRDQLSKESPEYDALMTQYQNMQNELRDITKTLGAGSKVASQNAVLASAIRSQKTPQKQQLLDKLTEIDPSIAYKVAGATLHDMTPVGLPQKFLEIGAAVPWGAGAYHAITSGQPLTAAALAAGYGAQAVAQSPRAMGRANYGVGRLTGAAKPVVSPVATAAKVAAPVAVTAQSAEKRKRPVFSFSDTPILETNMPPAQASGGRIARKSGGRIRGNPISAEVKRVRALLAEKTASMLSVPDDAIATALHIAKRT